MPESTLSIMPESRLSIIHERTDVLTKNLLLPLEKILRLVTRATEPEKSSNLRRMKHI